MYHKNPVSRAYIGLLVDWPCASPLHSGELHTLVNSSSQIHGIIPKCKGCTVRPQIGTPFSEGIRINPSITSKGKGAQIQERYLGI